MSHFDVQIVLPLAWTRHNNIDVQVEVVAVIDTDVYQKSLKRYERSLKEKYLLSKVTRWEKNRTTTILKCVPIKKNRKYYAEESEFIAYLMRLGFLGISSLGELGQMETQKLDEIYQGIYLETYEERRKRKFKSRKVFMSQQQFVYLLRKLQETRGMLEQLAYTDTPLVASSQVDWANELEDCDTILDYISDFSLNLGLFMLINKEVKKSLLFFSDFSDNVKESNKS